MRIRNLDTFYWIATLRSFRAAADHLNLTQPAVSARIQQLEQDLGARVFLREVRNAELTPAGRRLLTYAERYMALEQDILASFADTTPLAQTVRLGASETIVSTWLPDFLNRLGQAHPGLSFDLSVDSTGNMRDALVAREIDIAFLMGPVSEVSVTNTDLCQFEMIFAATPDIAAQHPRWRLADVAARTVLTFAPDTRPSRELREVLKPHARGALDMTTSSSMGALIRLALSGYGVCAMPRAVIASELASGQLCALDTDFSLPPIAFTASFVSSSPISALMTSIASDARAFLAPSLSGQTYAPDTSRQGKPHVG
jgi:DNA-binding transcriptional LysR family regulator